MRVAALSALLASGSLAQGPAAALFDSKALFEKSKAAVVQVNLKSAGGELIGNGTGFLVEDDGLVVTNHHVIDDAEVIELVFSDGRKTAAVSVVGDFPQTDLAVLKLDTPVATALLALADTTTLVAGDPVAIIGSPMGLGWTLTEGKVAAYRATGLPEELRGREGKLLGAQPVLQLSVPVAPGNSGGPVLDAEGRLVGVVKAQLGFGTSFTFAVPTAAVVDALDAARKNPRAPRVLATVGEGNRLWANLAVSAVVLGAAAWFVFRRRSVRA